jgi:hypothetical protein
MEAQIEVRAIVVAAAELRPRLLRHGFDQTSAEARFIAIIFRWPRSSVVHRAQPIGPIGSERDGDNDRAAGDVVLERLGYELVYDEPELQRPVAGRR